jgi:hypothetical protein
MASLNAVDAYELVVEVADRLHIDDVLGDIRETLDIDAEFRECVCQAVFFEKSVVVTLVA